MDENGWLPASSVATTDRRRRYLSLPVIINRRCGMVCQTWVTWKMTAADCHHEMQRTNTIELSRTFSHTMESEPTI